MNKNYIHIFCYMTIAAVVAGCANTNSSATTVPAENRDILIGFSVETEIPTANDSVASVFNDNFKHRIKLDGYSVFINDEEHKTNISLNDRFFLTAPVDAIVHVIHKDSVGDLNADVVDALSLMGSFQIKKEHSNVMTPMQNHDFGLITIKHSDHGYSSTLNNNDFYGDSYAYTARNEGLLISDTAEGYS